MTTNCAGCGNDINDLYYLECSQCERSFDFLRINISKEKYEQAHRDGWLCPSCVGSQLMDDNTLKPVRPSSAPPHPSNSYTCATSATSKQVATDALILKAEMLRLRDELVVSIENNIDIKNQMSALVDTMKQTLKETTFKLEHAEQQIKYCNDVENYLLNKIEKVEQDNLMNDLEITGIVENENEDLCSIITRAARKIGVDITESDIDYIMRVGPKTGIHCQQQTPRVIVVRMVRRLKRDQIIKAAKITSEITTENIVSGPPMPIFFNERLTRENRHIFLHAKVRAKEYGFQYCWIRNGKIYVRKAGESSAIHIDSIQVLEEKIGPAKLFVFDGIL